MWREEKGEKERVVVKRRERERKELSAKREGKKRKSKGRGWTAVGRGNRVSKRAKGKER